MPNWVVRLGSGPPTKCDRPGALPHDRQWVDCIPTNKPSLIINNNSNKSIYNTTYFQYHTTAKQRGILMSVCNLKNNKKVQIIYTYQSSRFQYIMVMLKIDNNTIVVEVMQNH